MENSVILSFRWKSKHWFIIKAQLEDRLADDKKEIPVINNILQNNQIFFYISIRFWFLFLRTMANNYASLISTINQIKIVLTSMTSKRLFWVEPLLQGRESKMQVIAYGLIVYYLCIVVFTV